LGEGSRLNFQKEGVKPLPPENFFLRNEIFSETDGFGLFLFGVIEDRHGASSTILTSQLPIESWHEHIDDPAIAAAILDRLFHNAHRNKLKGGSMRKKIKLGSP
jgi:DNA replication protein DnaC